MIPASIHTLDQDWTLAINSLGQPSGYWFWQMISDARVWIPMYAIIAVWMVRRLGWKRALLLILTIALTILCCDQFANLIKGSVARLRPCYDRRMLEGGLNILEGRGGFYGFFSAHAANAFGFAITSYLGLKQDIRHSYRLYGISIFVWATFVGVSRVFVGKHYLGDVLVGTLVGLLIGYLITLIFRYLERRYDLFHLNAA